MELSVLSETAVLLKGKLAKMNKIIIRSMGCCASLLCLLLVVHSFVWSASTSANAVVSQPATDSECVIALHGLVRTAQSMEKMVTVLKDSGYSVANIDYPSREKTVQELATPTIKQGLELCAQQGATVVHFVTHSMGGILLRQYLSEHALENLGRVVMLAPPNHGSEIVDKLGDVPGYELLNGPAGLQLGTDAASVPQSLGPVDFDLGVIAGTQSINLVLSTFLPDADDGKVSVASAQIEGMCDFLVLEVTHTFIMRNDDVIEQVLHYLQHGKFASRDEAEEYELQLQSKTLPDHCR